MRLSHDLPSRMSRGLFAVLMMLVWCGAAERSPAQQLPATDPAATGAGQREPTSADFRAAREQFERLCGTLQAIRRDLPRDSFDPQAVVDQVGRDPSKLMAWVREQTAWVPYRGLLRGSVGVLQDRCGNSLDRAVLLGDLLRRGGATVRLASAELGDEDAKAVWKAFAAPVPAAGPTTAGSNDPARLAADSARRYGMDPDAAAAGVAQNLLQSQRLLETLAERVAQQEPVLLQQLGFAPAGAPQAADQPSAADLAAAKDHWWVQYRNGENWVDADPLQTSSPAPARTVEWPSGAASPAIDESLCHTVTVRVVVERLLDGKPTTATALQQPLRPADLFGRRVVLYHHPTQWPSDLVDLNANTRPDRWRQAIAQQTEWVPMLAVDATTYTQAGILASGELNPKPVLSPLGQGGKAVAGAAEKAAALFDGMGAPPAAAAAPPGTWSAEWIEFEFKGPARETRVERRDVFDLLGPARRAAGDTKLTLDDRSTLIRGLALTGNSQLLLTPCKLDSTFVQDLAIGSLLDSRAALTQGMDAAAKGDEKGALAVFHIVPFARELYQYAMLRHLAGRWRAAVYLDRVNAAALHQRLAIDDQGGFTGRTVLDILANEVAVRPGAGTQRVRLLQGIIDTNAESLAAGEATHDMAGVFDAAEAQGVEWVTLRSADDAAWSKVQLDPDTAARVRADLRGGATVIVPARAVPRNGRQQTAWWRVDAASGQCLGMSEHGGASMAEQAFLTAVFVWTAVTSFAGCGGFAAGASTMKMVGCGVCALAIAAVSTLALAGTGSSFAAAGPVQAASSAGGAAGAIAGGGLCNILSAVAD